MRRTLHGHDAHPATATILHNMGNLYSDMQRYDEAADHYRQSMSMDRQLHGEGACHDDIAHTLHGLGLLNHDKGEYREAGR